MNEESMFERFERFQEELKKELKEETKSNLHKILDNYSNPNQAEFDSLIFDSQNIPNDILHKTIDTPNPTINTKSNKPLVITDFLQESNLDLEDIENTDLLMKQDTLVSKLKSCKSFLEYLECKKQEFINSDEIKLLLNLPQPAKSMCNKNVQKNEVNNLNLYRSLSVVRHVK